MGRRSVSSTLAIVATIAAVSLVGGRFGAQLGSLGDVAQGDSVAGERKRFEAVFGVISERLAEPVDQETAVYSGAIPAMLERLDPHSQFFDRDAFLRLREEQRGSYAGVGMQIRQFEGRTIVDFPFPGTPAFQAGVRPGDAIEQVDGVSTQGSSVEEVANLVRGREGTSVHLGLQREGMEPMLEFDLERANIPRPTIPLAFELSPRLGYIRITSFGETTSNELDQALDALGEETLDGLVLDLRDNNGGLLTAGVHVAGRFLDEGALVVSQRGRNSPPKLYRSSAGRRGGIYPLTVMVNCRSASASEIVAGALQDHDRALIVGSRTFGKGLVQSVFRLPESTGVVLTTARYLTPSGRLIQRTYGGLDMSTYYADPCLESFQPELTDARLTDAGRPVYGGAGIAPDVTLPRAGLDELQRRLIDTRAFERFADSIRGEVAPGWRADDRTLKRFVRFIQSENLEVAAAPPPSYRDDLIRRITRAAYTTAIDVDAGDGVDARLDPEVLAATDLLTRAAALIHQQPASAHDVADNVVDSGSPQSSSAQ